MNLIEKLRGLGYETIPADFYNKVTQWRSWYEGNVKGFHAYRIRNGHDTINVKRYSLEMAKKGAEDWANLLMNEKVEITVEGDKEQAFIKDVFEKNNWDVKVNEQQEFKFALGTVAYVCRVTGQSENAADEIKIDYVTIEDIYPLRWDNGIITECAFTSVETINGKNYIYLQIHCKDEIGNYVIKNSIYEVHEGGSISDVELTDVTGYENVVPEVHTNSPYPMFVIDRPNIANNYDKNLPVGISVYANAIDVLKGIDIAFDAYVNEFVLGKKRVMVSPSAEKYIDGEPVFDTNDVAYYVLPEEMKDGAVITTIDMKLRVSELSEGIQDMLNLYSSKLGFGESHYKFDRGAVATATEVISENSTMFRTIKKQEIVLNSALKDLVQILLRIGNSALSLGLNEEAEIKIDFDDSIIEDKNAEFSHDSQLLNMGIMNDWEFRAKWMNEDEETAKKMLPRMQQMVDEPQEEVE